MDEQKVMCGSWETETTTYAIKKTPRSDLIGCAIEPPLKIFTRLDRCATEKHSLKLQETLKKKGIVCKKCHLYKGSHPIVRKLLITKPTFSSEWGLVCHCSIHVANISYCETCMKKIGTPPNKYDAYKYCQGHSQSIDTTPFYTVIMKSTLTEEALRDFKVAYDKSISTGGQVRVPIEMQIDYVDDYTKKCSKFYSNSVKLLPEKYQPSSMYERNKCGYIVRRKNT